MKTRKELNGLFQINSCQILIPVLNFLYRLVVQCKSKADILTILLVRRNCRNINWSELLYFIRNINQTQNLLSSKILVNQASCLPQQFLYFLPLPHGQGSFLPIFAPFLTGADGVCCALSARISCLIVPTLCLSRP